MWIITLAILTVFFISIIWTWHNLGRIDNSKKAIFILVGMFICLICTFLVFQISKSGINYENKEIQNVVRNTLVSVFTALNSLILLPYIARQFDRVREKEIKKEKFKNKILLILFVFIISLILESGYLRDTQQAILEIYETYSNIL